jgi:biopolymer transport protein ExbD
MSEVQVKEQGNGKNKQKKQMLRVDFTPMVDMNMLLITFFMFCTTLLKPQVMNITMPPKEKAAPGSELAIRESSAITIIMGKDNKLYCYEGMPTEELYRDTSFLKEIEYGQEGIRKILLRKNEGVYAQIQDLKIQREFGKINMIEFDSIVNAIQKDANENLKIAPTVLIKPTDKSTYKNMVDILDEILICNIGFYQVAELSDGDRYLLYAKTNDPEYEVKAENNKKQSRKNVKM